MAKTKRNYKPPIWSYNPNKKNKSKKFVMVYHDQLFDDKFKKMKSSSQLLYIRMLDYSNGQQTTHYPRRMYKDLMSSATFNTCVKELINNGFIELVESGRFNHKENLYKFSTHWYK